MLMHKIQVGRAVIHSASDVWVVSSNTARGTFIFCLIIHPRIGELVRKDHERRHTVSSNPDCDTSSFID